MDNMLYPGFLGEDEDSLSLSIQLERTGHQFQGGHAFSSDVQTGAIQHNAVIGFDYYRYLSIFLGESIDFSDLGAYVPIDIYNPIYRASSCRLYRR